MIAPLRDRTVEHNARRPDQFLAMLPQIRRQASIAFCHRGAEARDELIQEVIANAYRAWVRLVKRERAEMAFPTPLAQFAIRQVRAGRRVGIRLNNSRYIVWKCPAYPRVDRRIARSAGSAVRNAESTADRRSPRGSG